MGNFPAKYFCVARNPTVIPAREILIAPRDLEMN
jgi:hypothetical protein